MAALELGQTCLPRLLEATKIIMGRVQNIEHGISGQIGHMEVTTNQV